LKSIRKFNPLRTARFALARLAGRLALMHPGVKVGAHLDAIGRPVLTVHSGSSITIGACVSLISKSFATALGVNHPVVLQTLKSCAQIRIGEGVGISGGTICAAEFVEIGAGSMLGANVIIADTDFHTLSPAGRSIPGHEDPSIKVKPIVIGRRVFIGANTIVLKGVTIGDNSIVGAGSVVTRSIPGNCIAAGNPCRVIRFLSTAEVSV
jgi:acetyltransferase-like isoleucine patch superfamily enzyme